MQKIPIKGLLWDSARYIFAKIAKIFIFGAKPHRLLGLRMNGAPEPEK
jgi:hypothetical protein